MRRILFTKSLTMDIRKIVFHVMLDQFSQMVVNPRHLVNKLRHLRENIVSVNNLFATNK